MRCPNCNSLIADDINFCNYCGTPLKNNNKVINTSITSDEDYVKVYIGNNYEEISKKGFNIYVFLFGDYYFLYRKSYNFFLIDILLSLVSIFLFGLTSILIFGYRVYMAIKFNELYLKKAEEEVAKIKQENANKTIEEIKELCRKKGGTSTTAPFILMGVLFMLCFLLIFGVLFLTYDQENNPFETYTTEETLGNLNYSLPNGFEDSSEYEDFKTYYYMDTESMNIYTISINYLKNTNFKSGKDYLEYYKETIEPIHIDNINNIEWYYYEKNNNYYYSTIYNNYIYYIDFSIVKDNGIGNSLREEFLKSLTFENKQINSNNNTKTDKI